VADFNGDGKLDLAVANWYDETVSILPGDGKGGFGAATTYKLGDPPSSLAVGDFDHDGSPDLAAGTNSYTGGTSGSNVWVLLNKGDGTFSPAQSYSIGVPFASSLVAYPAPYEYPIPINLAVVSPDDPTSQVTVMWDSFGSFTPTAHYATGSQSFFVTVGDFNRDGNADLAVANFFDGVSVLLGDGKGGFLPATNYAVNSQPYQQSWCAAVGDFNGDGNPDLAVGTTNGVSILLGDGKGGFGPATTYAPAVSAVSVAVGDFDGDGTPDLAVVDGNSGTVDILLNQSRATTVAISSNQSPSIAGQLVTLTATVTEDVAQAALPTGLVTFMDGTTALGTGTLDDSVPPLTANGAGLTGGTSPSVAITSASLGGQAGRQLVLLTGSPTGGTFTLSFNGQTTVNLAYNVPATGGGGPSASLQNALNARPRSPASAARRPSPSSSPASTSLPSGAPWRAAAMPPSARSCWGPATTTSRPPTRAIPTSSAARRRS
jgi:hypothetical protein